MVSFGNVWLAIDEMVGAPTVTRKLRLAVLALASVTVTEMSAVPEVDDSIDLGATVLPVLLKTYAPHAVVGLIGVLIGWLIARRRS